MEEHRRPSPGSPPEEPAAPESPLGPVKRPPKDDDSGTKDDRTIPTVDDRPPVSPPMYDTGGG
jgi:hypothetical protein